MAVVGIMMSHVLFGVIGTLLAVALFVEVLNLSESNVGRIKILCIGVVVCIVAAYLIGGYWYVTHYAADKALIKSGPWPWAHNYFMEVKEHIFFILLLLSIYLPFAVFNKQLLNNPELKKLILVVSGLIIIFGLTMDGFGAIIAMGAKVALIGG